MATYTVPNVEVVGNVNITNDCIASGFSKTNYLTIPASLATNTGTEYVICVITGNDITGDQPFAQASTYVDMSIYEGDLSFYTWSNSTHNTIGAASPNTKYWVKEVVNGTSKSYSYSTDGINYSTPVVKTDTTQTVPTSFTLGVQSVFDHIFTGSIDLKECYIKAGNDIVWQGTKEVGTKLKAIKKVAGSINYYAWHNSIIPDTLYTKTYPPERYDKLYYANGEESIYHVDSYTHGNDMIFVLIAGDRFNYSRDVTQDFTLPAYTLHAVTESVSINYYGWMGSGYLTMYTTSDTPSVGDNAYFLPNPSAVVGTITQATINNITVNGTTVDRQNYLDTTYTGNIYQLINQ